MKIDFFDIEFENVSQKVPKERFQTVISSKNRHAIPKNQELFDNALDFFERSIDIEI